MIANDSITLDAQQQQVDRKRKRKAILAGGVVLGLGAAMTLAAWSDGVFSNGIFNTGSFELEGNVVAAGTVTNTTNGWAKFDGTAAGSTDADLAFNQEITNKSTLSYDEPVFAPIALRLSDATTVDATVELVSAQIISGPEAPANTLLQKLDYSVYSGIDAATCTASTPSTDTDDWVEQVGGTIDNTVPSGAFTTPLTKVTAAGNDQSVIPLCIKVTLNDNSEAAQGVADTTVQWQFTATQTVS